MLGKERNNEINDLQFTDHAWSEMAKMLDQEMPVAKRPSDNRGRYGLLLLFLLIGFGSGIGTMLLIQDNPSRELENPTPLKYNPKEVANADQPVAANINNQTHAETDQLKTLSKLNKDIESKIQTNFSNTSSSEKTQNQNVIDQKNLLLNSSSVIVFKKDDHSNNNDQKKMEELHVQPYNHKMSDRLADLTSDHVQEEVSISSVNQDFKPLALLANNEIPMLDIEKEVVTFDLLPFNKRPKVDFGVYLGTQTRDFGGMHGLSTGAFATVYLDEKFSLRSGIGFSKITGFHPKTIGAMEPLTPEFFEPISTIVLDEYSTVSSLESNQDLPIESLQYLDLPVSLNYRMSNNFGILMGVKFSYLLDAKTDRDFSEGLDENEKELLDDALYNSMRNMDVATVLGFGYYPTRKVGVELKYNHGLVDYTIDENWHVRQLNSNKTFELSLRYLFK